MSSPRSLVDPLCMWRLNFKNGFQPGNFVVLAHSASEAREKMLDAWSKTMEVVVNDTIHGRCQVYDNTFPYVPSIYDLVNQDVEIDHELEKNPAMRTMPEEALMLSDKPNYETWVMSEDGEEQELVKCFTIAEVIKRGWIVRIEQQVMINLALDG